MTRLDDWIRLLDDPSSLLKGSDPIDDALGALLVHLAFSDGEVQDDEMAFFVRIFPDRPRHEVVGWIEAQAVRPVDLEAFAPLVQHTADREKLLGLAARVVGLDSAVATEEVVVLHRLADHFALPPDAIRRAIDAVVAQGGAVPPSRVEVAVRAMAWEHLVVLPPSWDALVVLGRTPGGPAEVAVERDGLWARFEQGEARVRFADIVSYTRLPVRGRAFHVRTDGADHTLVEAAFQDVGRLLDRVYER